MIAGMEIVVVPTCPPGTMYVVPKGTVGLTREEIALGVRAGLFRETSFKVAQVTKPEPLNGK